jgi:glycosyltransferase involved in cell wall biosynthesis
MGLAIEPGCGCFEEVAPRKWFIPNCVDVDHFRRTETIDELKNRKIIIVPRQITPDRGIDLAIRAFRLFLQTHADYYLYIVGKVSRGSEVYFEECKDLVKKLGLEDRVVFTGFIQRSLMPYYYSSATLTLIPTVRREGTSLSALESMACGTATVTTNVAGLQDLPSIQANPIPADIAGKMIETIDNLSDISFDQCNKVRQVFNLSNWSKAWLRVIETVSARKAM